jgi:hypothetical protein
MKTQSSIDRLTKVIILINTLLMLVGVVAIRYDHVREPTKHWSPSQPPSSVDPFSTYRQPLL